MSEDGESNEEVEKWGEDLVGDANDRVYLNQLSNLERETILADRFARRKEHQERKKAKARLSRKGRTGTGASKPETKADKLTAKKRELEQKYEEEEEEEEEQEETKGSSRKKAPTSSSRSQKTVEEDDKDEGEPASYEDALKMQMTRKACLKICNEPYFQEIALGSLVRVNIGTQGVTPVYHCADVRELIKRKQPAQIEKKDVWFDLTLGMGESTKSFKVVVLSNGPITQAEFEKWQRKQKEAHRAALTKADVEKKQRQVKDAENFVYTDDAVQEVLEKRFMNLRKQPINVLRKRKLDVTNKLSVLRDNRVDLDDQKDEEASLIQQLHELDELIKEKAEEVEKVAEIKGVSFNKRVREGMYETANHGEPNAGEEEEGASKEPNPFVRRKTIQHTMHFGEEAERLAREEAEKRQRVEEQERAAQEEKKRKEEAIRASQLLSDINSLKRKKTAVVEERVVLQGLESAQLLSQAHNFELDIDI